MERAHKQLTEDFKSQSAVLQITSEENKQLQTKSATLTQELQQIVSDVSAYKKYVLYSMTI